MVPLDIFHRNTKHVAHLILHLVGNFQHCYIFGFQENQVWLPTKGYENDKEIFVNP